MITKHYNINQLRIDLWNELKDYSINLIELQGTPEFKNSKEKVHTLLINLKTIEQYFAFPGKSLINKLIYSFNKNEFKALSNRIIEIVYLLVSDQYRTNPDLIEQKLNLVTIGDSETDKRLRNKPKKYFEVLYVEDLSTTEEEEIKLRFKELVAPSDNLAYEVVVQNSFQDALIALFFNYNIQAVCIRFSPKAYSDNINNLIAPFIQNVLKIDLSKIKSSLLGTLLGSYIKQFRPELDIYYITDTAVTQLNDKTLKSFRRIFYRMEDFQELHLAIINGINQRFETPFFNALLNYSQKPVSVFHAMPISRGNSVFQSRWMHDFEEFYGRNIFLAESSATHGGLDSLLQPTGSIKKAQEKAAKAFGAEHTFFVTNGTSTANKIVQQALIKPGDVVLVDRDCHKSHHYGLVLAGAFPAYLDSYPIEKYSMYGAVPLKSIKERLIALRNAGRLDKVKMILLTNCTFDGIVYNVERVMEEVLTIKPDMVFLWDEAWFAYASFTYTFKQRTAMYVAQKLYNKYHSDEYRNAYNQHLKNLKPGELPSMPDPNKVKIRVYATQSTHKTLSSFRQGSMIQVWDEEFSRLVADTFAEAYMTHTTTSPNYQIIASLDVGRRQVELEGYEMVERAIEMAMSLRSKILDHPKLSRYFSILTINDLIPPEYRQNGLKEYYSETEGWDRLEKSWEEDEFILDPTKITLSVGKTGINGNDFKNKYLMDKFNIQVNKTSRNTVLLMTNIGTTRSSVTYLINALLQIADELDERNRSLSKREAEIEKNKVNLLINNVPPLPDFSEFHRSFLAAPGVPGGNLREAYYLAYQEEMYEYILLNDCLNEIKKGRELVATSFVIPYPPGFPILVPGQVINEAIINFLIALDVKEIHGYRADLGLKVFTEKALNRKNTISALGAMAALQQNKLNQSKSKKNSKKV
jgi:arginine decarboxylase